MKILACTDFLFPSFLGGSARFATDLNSGLAEVGVDVTSITRPSGGTYAGEVLDGDKKVIYTKNPARIIRECLKPYDYFISHHPVYGFLLALIHSNKLIYFYHGPFAEEYSLKTNRKDFSYFIRKQLEQFTLKRARLVIVVSDYMATKIVDWKQKTINLGPIQSQNDGNYPPVYRNDPKKRVLKALLVRRLTARTGVNNILQLASKSKKVSFTVVGAGELRESLLQRFGSRVKFYHKLSDEELKKQYRDCDLIILPTVHLEGFGLVMLEAFSLGRPVLATTTSGGAYEFLLKIGIKTFLDIEVDNMKDIERKSLLIVAEFQDPKIQARLGKVLRKTYYKNYASRFIDVL